MVEHSDIIILDEIRDELKIKYSDFKGIYFFGSRLRGNNAPDSDFDILLVFNREINTAFKREIRDIVYDFMLRYDIVIDTKIFSENDMRHPNMPFTEEVKSIGYYHAV
jgi:predicted nucleotidyltransferase